MSEEPQLIDAYLDGELTSEEQGRFAEWLAADAEHVREFVRETYVHRQIREVMLASPYRACGLSEVDQAARRAKARPVRWGEGKLRRLLGFHWSPTLPGTLVGAAACAVLAVAVGFWCLGPLVGEPVLAEVQGTGLSLERDGQPVSVLPGTRLQAGDVLRTPEAVRVVIGFAPEKTRLTLHPGTELKLMALSQGKRLTLSVGHLEASVARQRPFRAMILITPQAEARVLGTKFSLRANTNSTRLEVTEGKVRLTRDSDGAKVPVPAGYYAVVADATELAALPQTGGLLREWWTGVKGKTRFSLSEEPRFPYQPDGRNMVPDFELKIAETNQFAVRLCGYVHPPVTGDYNFWLERPPADFAAVGFANLMMSPTENPSEAVQIAQTSAGGSLVSPYITVGTTAASPPIPLKAGQRYYIEARIVIGRGEGQLSVAWKPPGESREALKGNFLSPWKPK